MDPGWARAGVGTGSALGELSNSSIRESNGASTSGKPNASSPTSLRHMNSLRVLREGIYSSDESLPGSTDSIYNAEVVLSNDDLLQIPARSDENWPLVTYHEVESLQDPINSATLISTSSYPSLHTTSSHSNWPVERLDTILEQNSHKSIRLSSSHSRLRSSPERRSKVVNPKESYHSVRPDRMGGIRTGITSSRSILSDHTVSNGSKHVRSWSCNDLDCLDDQPSRRVEVVHSLSSSSSAEFFRTICPCPAAPRVPPEAPPNREPTPPGLASFGTPEAQQYRLANNNTQHRQVSRWRRWWFGSEEESDHIVSSTSGPSDPGSFSPEMTSPPMDLVKRMLGMSRPLSNVPGREEIAQRVPLPPGVITVNEAGFLARADDGTYVRGRFGNRASAHGVGHRGIESHPLHGPLALNAIEEACLEIDKACAATDMAEQRAVQAPRPPGEPVSPPAGTMSPPRARSPQPQISTTPSRSEIARKRRDSEMARIGFSSLRSAPASHAYSSLRTSRPLGLSSDVTIMSTERPQSVRSVRSIASTGRPQSVRSARTVLRMEEPALYGSGAIRPSGETTGTVHDFAEQGQQHNAGQPAMNEKTGSRSCWKVCRDDLRLCFCPVSMIA